MLGSWNNRKKKEILFYFKIQNAYIYNFIRNYYCIGRETFSHIINFINMMIIKLKLLKITKENRLFVLPIYIQKEKNIFDKFNTIDIKIN